MCIIERRTYLAFFKENCFSLSGVCYEAIHDETVANFMDCTFNEAFSKFFHLLIFLFHVMELVLLDVEGTPYEDLELVRQSNRNA